MFRQASLNKVKKHTLDKVLDSYLQIANGQPKQLRNLIPVDDMWRFFIDGHRQHTSRGLSVYFIKALNLDTVKLTDQEIKDIFNVSILRYCQQYEVNFLSFETSSLYQAMQSSYFLNFSEELIKSDLLDKVTIMDLVVLDSAWLAFEINEPGYLNAMQNAHHAAIPHSCELMLDDIKRLHAAAGERVKGTNYSSEPNDHPGQFRSRGWQGYLLNSINSTLDGLQQIFDQALPYKKLLIRLTEFIPWRKFYFEITISTVSKNIEKCQLFLHEDTCNIAGLDKNIIGENAHNFNRFIGREIMRLSQFPEIDFASGTPTHFIESVTDLLIKLQNLIHHSGGCSTDNDKNRYHPLIPFLASIRKGKNQLQAKSQHMKLSLHYRSISPKPEVQMLSLLTLYQNNIQQMTSMQDKLITIITFIQNCEQLHPFADLNCRTFCIILLNKLLQENNFPPTILCDPNCFDAFSTEELYQKVIRGMHRTFKLIQTGELFGIKTSEVIEHLASKPYLRNQFTYFKSIIMSEENDRQENKVKPLNL